MIGRGRRWVVLGAAAGVLTLGAVTLGGAVMAQTGGGSSQATPTPQAGGRSNPMAQARVDQFLNDLAKNLGVDRSKLDSALKLTADQEIDAAVKNGDLTQQQGADLKQKIDSGQIPAGLGGIAGLGRFEFRGDAQALMSCAQAAQTAVSQALGGETADQIRADLRAGKSPDDIAKAHNTTVQAVQNAVATAIKPCLDQAVQAGTLTAKQAQDITDRIKSGKGFGAIGLMGGFGGHRGPGGPHGPGGPNGPGRRNATPAPGTQQ